MAYSHGIGATFVPGGFDDEYYMPPPRPELVAPEPQRYHSNSDQSKLQEEARD